MGIKFWKETDFIVNNGMTNLFKLDPAANLVQIINRQDGGGGNVFADNRANVSTGNYTVKVEQGKNGNIVRPYPLQNMYLVTDAAQPISVTIIQALVEDLGVVFNASQVLQIQGSVTVNQPVQIAGTVATSGSVEVMNDVGNPLPVSGTVEVANDAGNPLPVSGTVEITNDVGNPIPVSGTVSATIAAALPAGGNNIGDVDVLTLPNVTLTRDGGKTAIKATVVAASTVTVQATPGKVWAIKSLGVSVELVDGATPRWGGTGSEILPVPIDCTTNIKLVFAGAGDCYIMYE